MLRTMWRDVLSRERSVEGTPCGEDALWRGRIIPGRVEEGTLCGTDALSRERFVEVTLCVAVGLFRDGLCRDGMV